MAQPSLKFQLILLAATSLFVAPRSASLFAQAANATRILVCESSSNACSQPGAQMDTTWTFNGTAGSAASAANPSGSRLTIDKFDSDAIVVERVDDAGPTPGLTATYTGTVHGTQIAGTVQYSWPGHPEYPASGTFSAVLQDSVAAASPQPAPAAAQSVLPPNLLVCENHGACNAAWIFNGNQGTATWFTRNPVKANLTVDRAEPDYIRIRRTDTTDGASAVYAGSLHGDHYSGTIIYSSPGHPGDTTGTWTATVPQTTCDPQANLDSADAQRIGQTALMFHEDHDAFNCYIVAAKDGDSTAQTAVGLIYYQGRGDIAQDYTQAFFWLHKAADQGVYAAQRLVAEMYTAGQGTSRDATLAGIYTARADEQKHDLERQQDLEERATEHAERAADRNAQVMSSFVLGATFGAFLFF
jgi:hypothetical protein